MTIKRTINHQKPRSINHYQRKSLSFRPSARPSVRDEKRLPKSPKQRRTSANLGSDLLAYPANNQNTNRLTADESAALNLYAPYLFHAKEPNL